MLADVVAACTAVGPTFVVAPPATDARPGPRSSPTRAAARARRCAPGSRPRRSPAGGAGPFLVVNADLPCVTPRDLLALAGAVPDGGLALAAGRRRDDERARARARPTCSCPLYGPGSAARFAALAPVAARRGARTSSTTSTRSPISSGCADGSGRARAARSPRCGSERAA